MVEKYEDISKITDYGIIRVNAIVNEYSSETIVFCIKYKEGWYAVDID